MIAHTNARREHSDKIGGSTFWSMFLTKAATNINGNLKTLILTRSQVFKLKPITFFGK